MRAQYLTVVCARADHPEGYGHKQLGTAHGYVLLVVEKVPADGGLERLGERLRRPVREAFGGWWATWYGGRFESVVVLRGRAWHSYGAFPTDQVRSLGDNRAVRIVDFEWLLASDAEGC